MPEQLFYNSVGPAHNYDPRTQDSILLWHDSAIMWSTNVHHSGRCRRVVSHNFWGVAREFGGQGGLKEESAKATNMKRCFEARCSEAEAKVRFFWPRG